MKPRFVNGNVIAHCPDCYSNSSTFEYRKERGTEHGGINIDGAHEYKNKNYENILYRLLRCAGCGRGGIAKIHCDRTVNLGVMETFYPFSIDTASIPDGVPTEIETEFREAEICASFGALRAASALFRSTLEKTLKANGYTSGNLKTKINKAAEDGVITGARKNRIHEDIRVLGNDVLHEEWRKIDDEEVELSHHYAQRILEDFYDDRESVKAILIQKERIQEEKEEEEDNNSEG